MKLKITSTEKQRIKDLPAGQLFVTDREKTPVLKSEYQLKNGLHECYIVGSGEMFWGGCNTVDEVNNLLVTPVQYYNK